MNKRLSGVDCPALLATEGVVETVVSCQSRMEVTSGVISSGVSSAGQKYRELGGEGNSDNDPPG